jgi:hypothetical protein
MSLQRDRSQQAAHELGRDRVKTQGLLARGVEQPVSFVRRKLALDFREYIGRAVQPVDGPGERDRRRLVPGDQQGQQVIAHVPFVERASVVVAGREHQREHVVARRACRSPRADLAEEQLVERSLGPQVPRPGPQSERCAA